MMNHEEIMSTALAKKGLAPREPKTGNSLFLKRAFAGLLALGAAAWTLPAQAHVKWFAPYIVDAAPQPIMATLTNVWFWTGIGLVLAFFLATLAVERTDRRRRADAGTAAGTSGALAKCKVCNGLLSLLLELKSLGLKLGGLL